MAARKRIATRRVNVGKGLSREDALRKALNKSRGDFRGFSYDKKTGIAVLI